MNFKPLFLTQKEKYVGTIYQGSHLFTSISFCGKLKKSFESLIALKKLFDLKNVLLKVKILIFLRQLDLMINQYELNEKNGI